MLTLAVLSLTIPTMAPFGCSLGQHGQPSWIHGHTPQYSLEQYLLGVRQGESQAVAEERAYAAIARIFKAQVVAESRDIESVQLGGRRGAIPAE